MKTLIIAFVLFTVGGAMLQEPDLQDYGGILVTVSLLWLVYRLVIKPIRNVVARLKDKSLSSSAPIKPSSSNANTKELETDTVERIEPKHNLLVVSVKKSISDGNEIYDAARYAWKLNVDRARTMDYVLAHNNGHIIGVFMVDDWLPATDDEFATLESNPDPDRWGFVGSVAPSEILLQYFNKYLPDGFIKRGAANPVRFIEAGEPPEVSELHVTKANPAPPPSAAAVPPAIETDDLITEVRGRIDGDGDFSAWAEIPTDQFGKEGSLIFVKSSTTATLNGQSTASNEQQTDYLVGNQISVGSQFEKIPGKSGDEFSVDISLDIFEVRTSKKATFTADSFATSIEIDGCQLSIISAELDEDGDLNVGYKITNQSPAIFGVSIAKEGEDQSPYLEEGECGETENSSYVMGLSEDDRVVVTLTLMQPLVENLQLSSVGEIEVDEPNESDTDDSFFDQDDGDESINVFVGCVDLSTPIEEGDGDLTVVGEKIRERLHQVVDAIKEYVDEDARFFVKSMSGGISEVTTISDLEIALPITTQSELDSLTNEAGYFHLRFTAQGNHHWDDGFLRASSEIPEGIYIWGYYPNIGELAVQGYYEGDFDTGIANDPDDDSYYSGSDPMEHYGLQSSDFDIDSYGL